MKILNAYENNVGEMKRMGQKNPSHIYLGTKCEYPEGHPVAVVPHPEDGIVLSRSAIEKVRAYLKRHEKLNKQHHNDDEDHAAEQ